MKQKIKIAVIGGTGKSGKYLIKELLQQGFSIKMLHRKPETLQIDNLTKIKIVKGDARDFEAIKMLISDCDAVISTLGQPIGEPSIFSDATKNVIRAMNEVGINRYIVTTGLNVDTPSDNKSEKTRFGTDWMKTNYPKTTADKQVEYEGLVRSSLEWTLVRLPLIEQTSIETAIIISLEDCIGDKISATSLAKFLIRQLTDINYLRASPFIANS